MTLKMSPVINKKDILFWEFIISFRMMMKRMRNRKILYNRRVLWVRIMEVVSLLGNSIAKGLVKLFYSNLSIRQASLLKTLRIRQISSQTQANKNPKHNSYLQGIKWHKNRHIRILTKHNNKRNNSHHPHHRQTFTSNQAKRYPNHQNHQNHKKAQSNKHKNKTKTNTSSTQQ